MPATAARPTVRPSLTLRLTMYSTAGPGMTSRASEATAKAAKVEASGTADNLFVQTGTSMGAFGGPSSTSERSSAPSEAGTNTTSVAASISSQAPPTQLEHVLGVQLLPAERGRGLEHVVDVDQVDLLALAVVRAVDERDDVQAVPDVRPDGRTAQPELLLELAAQRRLMASRRGRARRRAAPNACRWGTRIAPAAPADRATRTIARTAWRMRSPSVDGCALIQPGCRSAPR